MTSSLFRLCSRSPRLPSPVPSAAFSVVTPAKDLVNLVVGERSRIQGFDDFGFEINHVNYRGSVLVLPFITLLWDARTVADITLASLSPAHLIKPRINLLIIGTGQSMVNINPNIYGYFRQRGVAVEIMASNHAIAAFGVLNEEDRPVAAALLCETPLTREECCLSLPGGAAAWNARSGKTLPAVPKPSQQRPIARRPNRQLPTPEPASPQLPEKS